MKMLAIVVALCWIIIIYSMYKAEKDPYEND